MLRTIFRDAKKGVSKRRRKRKRKGGKEYLTLDLSNHITVVAFFECYSEVVDSGILLSLPLFFSPLKICGFFFESKRQKTKRNREVTKKEKTDQKVISSFVRECPSLLPSYSSESMVTVFLFIFLSWNDWGEGFSK